MKVKKFSALKHILLALAFAFAVTAFIPAVNTVEAQAKTIKITANPKWQKAPVMRKTGKYAVTQKKGDKTYGGFISFVAPKTGTYKFTINNIKTLGSNATNLGNWYPLQKDLYGSTPASIKVKTEGGQSSCLWTASSNFDLSYVNAGKKKVSQYLKSRSATIKMTKGQKIYFEYYYVGVKCTYNITIKKTK